MYVYCADTIVVSNMILCIMRLSILFLLFLVSCSKYTKLEGVYFSKQQDALVLYDDEGKIESGQTGILENLSIKQTRTKLKFRRITYSPRRWLFKKNVYKYYFKIDYKTDDSIMVSPISKLAKNYFNDRDSLVFKTKYAFADQNNSFIKIVYHSSRCFGYCDDLHLELDYSGNLKVTNNGNGLIDSAKNDNYIGKLSYNDLESLRNVLKYSQLKTLHWPADRNCYDFPFLTLILYQPSKRYYFKMNAACLPVVSYELTRYLNRLFKHESLHKVDTTFIYER